MNEAITKEANEEATEYKGALETAKRLTIETPEDFAFVADLARNAKANWNRLEARRTDITKPLLASKRKVDDLFKPALNALAEIERLLKDKIAGYTEAQRALQVAAMNASAMAFAAGETPTEAIPEVQEIKGVSVSRSYWVADIVQPDLVPRGLCSPDRTKIANEIYMVDPRTPPPPIPGLTFRIQTDVTLRASK